MSATPLPGWSLHAQQVAWFEAWLRALRRADVRGAEHAQRELRLLGLDVRPVPPPAQP